MVGAAATAAARAAAASRPDGTARRSARAARHVSPALRVAVGGRLELLPQPVFEIDRHGRCSDPPAYRREAPADALADDRLRVFSDVGDVRVAAAPDDVRPDRVALVGRQSLDDAYARFSPASRSIRRTSRRSARCAPSRAAAVRGRRRRPGAARRRACGRRSRTATSRPCRAPAGSAIGPRAPRRTSPPPGPRRARRRASGARRTRAATRSAADRTARTTACPSRSAAARRSVRPMPSSRSSHDGLRCDRDATWSQTCGRLDIRASPESTVRGGLMLRTPSHPRRLARLAVAIAVAACGAFARGGRPRPAGARPLPGRGRVRRRAGDAGAAASRSRSPSRARSTSGSSRGRTATCTRSTPSPRRSSPTAALPSSYAVPFSAVLHATYPDGAFAGAPAHLALTGQGVRLDPFVGPGSGRLVFEAGDRRRWTAIPRRASPSWSRRAASSRSGERLCAALGG